MTPEQGTLSVSWRGTFSGRFEAPASATWCPADTALELLATRGDTGVGVALFARESLHPVQHPTASPQVEASWRPMSLAAVRWSTDTQILGFESVSGVVNVTQASAGTVSGSLDVRLRRAASNDTLHLTGRFTAVRIGPGKSPCGRASRSRPG